MIVELCNDTDWLLSEEAFALYAPCLYKPVYDDYMTKMENYVSNPSIEIFICRDNEKKTGVLVLLKDNQDAEIIGLSVAKDLRNKGIGRSLIKYVMDHGTFGFIKAQTDDDAIGFYRKCGFTEEMVEEEYPDGRTIRYNCILRKQKKKWDLQDGYLEENLFPQLFTNFEERPYGILFYNTANRDSYDSNHAVIYKDKTEDLKTALENIALFYRSKNLRPIIYQSMLDDGWFEEISDSLTDAGFKNWTEVQEYMLPTGVNKIIPNPEIEIVKIEKWSAELETVFMEAEELWEIEVAKTSLSNPGSWMFAARVNEKIIGLLYGHISERACRVDYLIVSKRHRRIGAGRALFYAYVEWCRQRGIYNAYLWPDGETPKRIYEEGGYEPVEIRKAGRAVLEI